MILAWISGLSSITSNEKGVSQCLVSMQGSDKSIRWPAANKTANGCYSPEQSSPNISYYCRQILCLLLILYSWAKGTFRCGAVGVLWYYWRILWLVMLFRTLRKESHYPRLSTNCYGLGLKSIYCKKHKT